MSTIFHGHQTTTTALEPNQINSPFSVTQKCLFARDGVNGVDEG